MRWMEDGMGVMPENKPRQSATAKNLQKQKKEMSQSSLIGHSVLALKYVWHSCKLAVRLGQKISALALW